MKIVFVITKADEIGGAQTHVLDLCTQLQNDGHDVKVVVGEDGLFVELLRKNSLEVKIEPSLVRPIDPVKDLKFIFRFRKILKEEAPDIVHLHSSKAGLLGRFANFGLDVFCVFTAHGWSFAEGIPSKKRKIYTLIERLTSNLLDRIITVSEHDKNLALINKVANKKKLIAVHNGVRKNNLIKIERTHSSNIKIIMVARFSEQKDHLTLFTALSKLTDLCWSIDLVGKGKYLQSYKNKAVSLGIADRINFLGERNDVPELLSRSDIFCLISNWEGFPISIVEAMQVGLPIVASNVGGVAEAVIHNRNGFLIERKDHRALAIHLRELITKAELRDDFGSESKKSFENDFTFEAMYKKTLDVYQMSKHLDLYEEATPSCK